MRRDPRFVAARGRDVPADGHAVDRLLVPLAGPAPGPASTARRRRRSGPHSATTSPLSSTTADTRPDESCSHVNGFDAEHHLRAVVDGDQPDPFVELGAGHRAARRRERRAGPRHLDVGAEPGHPQARGGGSCRRATTRARGGAARRPRGVSARRRRPCRGETARNRSPARRARPVRPTPRPTNPRARLRRRPRQRCRALVAPPSGVGHLRRSPCLTVCWLCEDTGERGGRSGLRRCPVRPGRPRRSGPHRGADVRGAGQSRRLDVRGGQPSLPGRRQAVPPAVHRAVGAAGARARRVAGHGRGRGHRAGAPGHAVPRRRDGRGADAPRRPQRQRPMGQQHRDPGRRLPVRDGLAAGVAAGPRRGADHRRHLRPAGDRPDAGDARRRRPVSTPSTTT